MTAFYLFAGLILAAAFLYEAVIHHPRAFFRTLVWLVSLLMGLVFFTSGVLAPGPLSAVLVNLWLISLIAWPVWGCVTWIRQGYRGRG